MSSSVPSMDPEELLNQQRKPLKKNDPMHRKIDTKTMTQYDPASGIYTTPGFDGTENYVLVLYVLPLRSLAALMCLICSVNRLSDHEKLSKESLVSILQPYGFSSNVVSGPLRSSAVDGLEDQSH